MERPRVLDILPPGYRTLFDRAHRVLSDDDRVRAMWLGGSLARGTADSASDLDVVLAVADEHFDVVASTWRAWLDDITPTVLAEELPFAKGSFYSITPGFERFDVVVEPVSKVPSTFFRTRVPVFDRDGLADLVPDAEPGAGPSADAVRALVIEYFRISAVETILVREDWLLAREHLHVVASLIYRLFVECNAPLPPMGVKQWSAKLTVPQRRVLAAVPTSADHVDELRTAHVALAAAFVTNAEAVARRLAIDWPSALEEAAAAHLRRELAIEDPYPRRPELLAV